MKREDREIKYVERWYKFTDKEVKTLRECLAYCRHRLNEHPEAGIRKGQANVSHINEMLQFLIVEPETN